MQQWSALAVGASPIMGTLVHSGGRGSGKKEAGPRPPGEEEADADLVDDDIEWEEKGKGRERESEKREISGKSDQFKWV